MESDEHAADIAHALLAMRLPDDDAFCWCGREKQPGEDHSLCWPGM